MSTETTDSVGLITALMSASAADLAHTTNSLLAGLEDQYRSLAEQFLALFTYVNKCEAEGRAPRERVLQRFDYTAEICERDLENDRLHPWPGKG